MPCLGIYLTGKVRRSGRTERDSPPLASCSGTPGRVSTTGAVAVPSPPRSARRRGRAGTRAGRRPKAAPRCARRAAGPLGDRRRSGPPRPSGRRVPLGRGARGGGRHGGTQRSRCPARPDGFHRAVPNFAALRAKHRVPQRPGYVTGRQLLGS